MVETIANFGSWALAAAWHLDPKKKASKMECAIRNCTRKRLKRKAFCKRHADILAEMHATEPKKAAIS